MSTNSMASTSARLAPIQKFVVLMLENRSFDHLVGYLKATDPRIAGISGSEFNFDDPTAAQPQKVSVHAATSYVMPFDPGHEFPDVQTQIYGPKAPPGAAPVMSGFVYSAAQAATAADVPQAAPRIMDCFQPGQVRVLSTLVREFAIFNFWHSSLPGPTWPNRFFVHAATSGGLTDSPDTAAILAGFSFTHGTIYDRLQQGGKDWRIYHDGLPQTAGIDSLRLEYVDIFTKHFREMRFFVQDVQAGNLPEYTFIEPNYDTGHNYQGGNSMHPLNDIRKGEALVKQVYETLRNSVYWDKVALIIIFDEHGGFYDHVPPPSAAPTGDDMRYADPTHPFAFDRLGIRVPAIFISAYTQRGTVIDRDADNQPLTFDHSSVLATVEQRFNLPPLTQRDTVAPTLEVALSQATPRLSATDAPTALPDPTADSLFTRLLSLFRRKPATATDAAPLSSNQQSFLDLALACDLKVTDPSGHQALRTRHVQIRTQKDAAVYIHEVEDKINSRRR